jgi:hypothetical protein
MRFTASVVKPPSYIYITNITVDVTNNIDLTWLVDNKAKILSYEVQNSQDNLTYTNVNILQEAPPIAPFTFYADSNNVQPQFAPYYYSVTVFAPAMVLLRPPMQSLIRCKVPSLIIIDIAKLEPAAYSQRHRYPSESLQRYRWHRLSVYRVL